MAADELHETMIPYLAGLGLGTTMRIRDLLQRGDPEGALAAAKELIAVHLRMAIEDADEAWITAMSEGSLPTTGRREKGA